MGEIEKKLKIVITNTEDEPAVIKMSKFKNGEVTIKIIPTFKQLVDDPREILVIDKNATYNIDLTLYVPQELSDF